MSINYRFKFFFIDGKIEPTFVETETLHKVGDIFNYGEDKYVVIACNYEKFVSVLRRSPGKAT